MARDKQTGDWLRCINCGRQIMGGGTKYCSKCRRNIKYDGNYSGFDEPLLSIFLLGLIIIGVGIFMVYILIKWLQVSTLTASLFIAIIITFLMGRFFFKSSSLKYLDWVVVGFLVFLFIYLGTKTENPQSMKYVIYLVFGLAFVYISIIFWKNKDKIKERQREKLKSKEIIDKISDI